MDLPGFNTKTTEQFIGGMARFAKFLTMIKYQPKVVVKAQGTQCVGWNVCFTGVRSDVAEKWIIGNGGKIASGVTKNTTLLIVKDTTGNSAKIICAQKLNIPIVSLAQFTIQYKI
jgi:NAD-dependent DNA ligase